MEGLPLHDPLKVATHIFWVGFEPIWRPRESHVCPAVALFVIVVALGTLAEMNTSTTSFACMRDWPTIVIGAPPAAAARNVGIAGPPPLMNAELELRKAICACAALP